MTNPLVGTWRLQAWSRHVEGAPIAHPLGPDAVGLLVYAPDGLMAVQMTAAHRDKIGGGDALGGSVAARAAAYSGCLAYFGAYDVEGETVPGLDGRGAGAPVHARRRPARAAHAAESRRRPHDRQRDGMGARVIPGRRRRTRNRRSLENHDPRADGHPFVEVDHVGVHHADAA